MKEKIKKYLNRSPWKIASDVIFWVLVILMLIPSTRSVFLGVFAKVRTVVLTPKIKASDGPILSASDNNWLLTDLEGNQVRLGDLKGEVLFVNFWATWCPPCRAEMPSIEKLFKAQESGLKAQGVGVVMLVVSNEEVGVVKEFIRAKGFTFPVYLARTPTPALMQSRSIPATFIFDKSGKLVFKRSGAFDWNSKKVRNFIAHLQAE